MKRKTSSLLAILLATGLAMPAGAQSTGEVTLIIADEERTVPVWSEQSDWSGPEAWPSINIYARSFDDAAKEPIVLSLGFEASGWQPSVPELQVVLFENKERVGELHAREEAERGGLIVALDSHAIDGSMLTISGSFEGTLGASEDRGRNIDMSNGIPARGSFVVSLEALD